MKKTSNKIKKLLLFVFVASVAIATRGLLLAFWLNSPFPFYSTVKGLDMETLLAMGVEFYHGAAVFALYNVLISGIMLFNSGEVSVTGIIVIQQIMGVATSLLTAWICLKLTGKKVMALGAGIIAALYAPALIYEAITLRESLFAFTAVLALAAMVQLHRKRFSRVWLFLAGIAITLPFTVRMSALLWLVICIGLAVWTIFQKTKNLPPLEEESPFKPRITVRKKKFNSIFNRYFASRIKYRLLVFKTLKKTGILLSGVLLVFVIVGSINFRYSGALTSISRKYINYIFAMGRQVNPKTVNIRVPGHTVSKPKCLESDSELTATYAPAKVTITDKNSARGTAYLINNMKKLGKLFSQHEIPNNINYCFMREYLFPCNILPGPGLVIPFAVAGIILLLLRGRFLHRELLLFLYIGAFALPITLFLPLGRYRLILYPIFSITMFYPLQMIFIYLKTIKTAKMLNSLKLCGIIILIGTLYIITLPENINFRSSDFITHGKAFQRLEGASENTEYCFAQAWQINPISPPVAINYTDILLKRGKTKQALKAIHRAWQHHPKHEGVALFTSTALLCNGMPKQAEQVLLNAGEPTRANGRKLYYHNLSESYRLQGKKRQALEIKKNH